GPRAVRGPPRRRPQDLPRLLLAHRDRRPPRRLPRDRRVHRQPLPRRRRRPLHRRARVLRLRAAQGGRHPGGGQARRHRPGGLLRLLRLDHRRPDARARRPSGGREPRPGARPAGPPAGVGHPGVRPARPAPPADPRSGPDGGGRRDRGRPRARRGRLALGPAPEAPARLPPPGLRAAGSNPARPPGAAPGPAPLPLAQRPTPVETLDRLTDWLGGPRLLIKRDDQTGLALGGNKARKLDHLCAEALALGCDTLVTGGGPQSNHCRMTAAAANRLGLHCHLALAGDAPGRPSGNLLLDHLLGADVHVTGAREYYDIEASIEALAEEVREDG